MNTLPIFILVSILSLHHISGQVNITVTSVNGSYILVRCCPDGSRDRPYTFNLAESFCQSTYNSSLASIHGSENYNELYNLVDNFYGPWGGTWTVRIWIGLTDLDSEGQYVWTDGTAYAPPLPITVSSSVVYDCVNLRYTNAGTMESDVASCVTATYGQFICNAAPTINPTQDPTQYPSTEPTTEPSIEPTDIPTNEPTNEPTNNPTNNPTKTPTNDPTNNLTDFPTRSDQPTMAPTISDHIIIFAPSPNPTIAVSSTMESSTIYATNDGTMAINATHNDMTTIIPMIIICVFVMIIIISCIDAKCIRINDFFKLGALIIASMNILDVVYDCLFAVKMNEYTPFGFVLLCFSFIVMPMFVTLSQLHTQINEWKRNDILSEWLGDNITFLYIISAITGSSFTGIRICTSNILNLRQFDMPLNKIETHMFQSKRVYSVVLLENVPQLALQIIYLSLYNSDIETVVFISMGFSILSIIISILAMMAQRNLTSSRDFVSIQFDVKGQSIVSNAYKHRNKMREIRNQITFILGINRDLIEIIRPYPIHKGLCIHINIYINNTTIIDMNLEQVMNDAQQNGDLAEIMKNAWSLSSVPLICNIKYAKHYSKDRKQKTVLIKANSKANSKAKPKKIIPMSVDIAMSPTLTNKEGQSFAENMARVAITQDGPNQSSDENESNDQVTEGNDIQIVYNLNNNHINDGDEIVISDSESTKGMIIECNNQFIDEGNSSQKQINEFPITSK